jgi:hypothetical protein
MSSSFLSLSTALGGMGGHLNRVNVFSAFRTSSERSFSSAASGELTLAGEASDWNRDRSPDSKFRMPSR